MASEHGPFQTEDDARLAPAVRAIYRASQASMRRGVMDELNQQMLTGACAEAGVELGAFDRRILAWLSQFEPQACAAVAGIIRRAARLPESAVTEWGVRFTVGTPAECPCRDEADARDVVASMREKNPEWDAVLIQRTAARPAGEWTEVPAPEKEGNG